VRVELTTRLAESRIAGFEGREGHRTPFASAKSIVAYRNFSQAIEAKRSEFLVDMEPERYRPACAGTGTEACVVRINAATRLNKAGAVQTS
jgi:hypothetical protein